MKNNKMFIYLFVFMFGLLFIGIDGVYAIPKCTYDVEIIIYRSDSDEIKSKEKKQIIITFDGAKIKGEKKSIDPGPLKAKDTGGLADSRISSLFLVEDDVLYCPNSIYLNYTSDSLMEYSLSGTPRTDSERDYVFKTSYLLSDPVVTGGAVLYNPIVNNKNEFLKCKDGWDSVGSVYYYAKLDTLLTNINGMGSIVSDEDLNSKVSELSNISAEIQSYCGSFSDQTIANKLNEIVDAISKKCNSSSKTTSESCSKLEEKTSSIQENVNIILGTVGTINVPYDDITVYDCNDLFSSDLKAIIKWLLKIIQIGGPILLIILSAVDFSQVIISNDQEALKKAVSKVIKRAIAAIVLFFVPLLVQILINWFVSANEGNDGFDIDPSCDISEW